MATITKEKRNMADLFTEMVKIERHKWNKPYGSEQA